MLYNRRDIVLKNYWLLDKVRGAMALGLGNVRSIARRDDGSKVFLRTRDCSSTIGLTHDEVDYYKAPCRAGCAIAKLIDDATIHHNQE